MDVIGGGLLVAVAAALWVAYLLPSWLRRRQYLATERNAVRLQQTLRILAETAETPEPVRVEATAREVANQQRILHEREATARFAAEAAEQQALAERRVAEGAADAARERAAEALAANLAATAPIEILPSAVGAAATQAPIVQRRPTSTAAARRALRRRRALCSLVLLVSLLTVTAGTVAAVFGATLIVPAVGAAGVVLALAALARLARVRPMRAASASQTSAIQAEPFEPFEFAEPDAVDDSWTPQPLPKPLHLSRGTIAATAMASIEAAAQLKRAEAGDDIARRVAELEPEVPVVRPKAPAAASSGLARPDERRAVAGPSAYASMGIIGDADPGFADLDAVLRRRRQAG